jgi:hypothetical protein
MQQDEHVWAWIYHQVADMMIAPDESYLIKLAILLW